MGLRVLGLACLASPATIAPWLYIPSALEVMAMKITWDERKRLANIRKHGLDFADLHLIFFATAIFRHGHSDRTLALGMNRGAVIIAVVFRPLGTEAFSVISMRPASVQERKRLGV